MKSFAILVTTLLASLSFAVAAPVEAEIEAPTSELAVRQIGGGPNDSVRGNSWSRTWPDTVIKRPFNFDAIPRGGCAYDIVFKRDPRDTKYVLAYFSVFGEGEVESQEEKRPSVIEYQGAIDADGYQTYYAYIEDACSTFFTARPPPRRLKVYFSPKKGQGTKGYISPLFY